MSKPTPIVQHWKGEPLVAGCRYEVTIRATYADTMHGGIAVFTSDAPGLTSLHRNTLVPQDIVALKRAEKPVAVGDMVQLSADVTSQPFYEVLKAASDYVVLWHERYGEAKVVRPHELRRAE